MIIISFSFLLVSCFGDEESTPISPTEEIKWQDYFPLSVGSWWVIERFETDSTFIPKTNSLKDSVVVTGISTIDGKEVFVVETYIHDGSTLYETNYYYGEGSKVFSYDTLYGSGTLGWVLLADFELSKQFVVEDTNTTNVVWNGGQVFTGYLKISLDSCYKTNLDVFGNNLPAYSLEKYSKFEGDVIISGVLNLEVYSEGFITLVYAKGVGFAEEKTKAYQDLVIGSEHQKGWRYILKKLLRYRIN